VVVVFDSSEFVRMCLEVGLSLCNDARVFDNDIFYVNVVVVFDSSEFVRMCLEVGLSLCNGWSHDVLLCY